MILRPALRQRSSVLGAISTSPLNRASFVPVQQRPQRQQIRQVHRVPTIGKHDALFKQHGVEDLYTPEAFDLAWNQYQKHMVTRLDHILADDARLDWDPKTILLDTARNPATANTFNYASMAHNNHFYFRCLSPKATEPPAELATALSNSFSSLDTLRSTFIATAAAMFGPGFVWLVQVPDAPKHATNRTEYGSSRQAPATQPSQLDFRILTTYLAGSPYQGAHTRQQPRDMNTTNLSDSADYMRQTTVQNKVGSMGQHIRPGGQGTGDSRLYGGSDVIPVLCVNTWEHAWMFDWGVDGKKQFLERWWDRIDWETVASHCMVGVNYARFAR